MALLQGMSEKNALNNMRKKDIIGFLGKINQNTDAGNKEETLRGKNIFNFDLEDKYQI